MAIEDFDGIPVSTEFRPLEKWDGCCWLLSDGKAVAVRYAGHSRAIEALTDGEHASYQRFMDEHHAIHVGDNVTATHPPTKVPREHLALLAGHFGRVSDALGGQEYKVRNYRDRELMWSV